MARKRVKGTKYNRVTKQQKYVFLRLCISDKQSIHEAAFNAGIHYSTAKTILFFHKKQYKNYETYIINEGQMNDLESFQPRAFYKDITTETSSSETPIPRIEVISKCYTNKSSQKGLWKKRRAQSDDIKQEEEQGCVKMENQSLYNKEWYQQMEQKVKTVQSNMKLELFYQKQRFQGKCQTQQYGRDEKQ